jgi:hypothetical protein
LFFLLFQKKAISQPYIKLIDNYSEWHVTNCDFGCLTDRYYTIGDTVINSLHYTFLDLYHYNKNFVIREDTIARKIYMRLMSQPSTAKEYLLYDFSLHINDTTFIHNPGSPYPAIAGYFIVDSILTKPLLTKNHRYFYLHSLDTLMANTKTTVWVEGIGSLCLINTPGAPPQINGVGQLSCFFSNGIQEYQDLDSIANCITIYPLGVKENKENNSINVLQNFDSENITLLSNQIDIPLTITLYNIDGKLELENLQIEKTDYQLSLANFSKGIYLLKITTNKGDYKTFKLINF